MLSNRPLIVFCILLTLLICNRGGVCQTKNITAQSIVEKMAVAYANASSYQDTGVIEHLKGDGASQHETVIKFRTYFARPHFFRFEWRDRDIVRSEERLSVVWNDGQQTFGYYSWDDPAVKKKDNIDLGIAGATGVSRGSAHTVPVLLMGEVGGFRLTQLINLSMLGEEEYEGEDCYIVRGYHPHNFPIDMWISKQDFLLRKVKRPNDNGSYDLEIRRDVKLDVRIPPEFFNFTPPPPIKPKSRPQICSLAFVLMTALCFAICSPKNGWCVLLRKN